MPWSIAAGKSQNTLKTKRGNGCLQLHKTTSKRPWQPFEGFLGGRPYFTNPWSADSSMNQATTIRLATVSRQRPSSGSGPAECTRKIKTAHHSLNRARYMPAA